MKNILYILLSGSILKLSATSTMQIPMQECLKARYGHTVGGTLYSKRILHKKMQQKYKKQLPRTNQEALCILKEKYHELKINNIKFVIKKCYGYYQSNQKLFDPNTLKLIR